MKNTVTVIMMLISVIVAHAQNGNRADTTLLGVYSTGARFTVTRADLGSQTATDLMGEMVIAFDTVKVITTAADSSRNKQKHAYMQQCNYISGLRGIPDLFKDKIVLMELNKDCDVTQICLLAQRSGAKAVMFIHNSNSNGNIKLPKKGEFKDSIRIPVFVVGKEKGEDISTLLPSMAGIKTKLPPPPTQNSVGNNNLNKDEFLTKTSANTEGSAETTANETAANEFANGKQGFTLSPNPTSQLTNVQYQFTQPTDVTIEVETASGQVLNRQLLRGVTVGRVEIPTADYASGTYFVTLRYGKAVRTKQLVVEH